MNVVNLEDLQHIFDSHVTPGECYDRGGFPGDTLDRVREYGVNTQELVTTSSTRLLMTT